MNKIIRLEPVFKYRIWGGTRLKEYFGYDIPTDKTGDCLIQGSGSKCLYFIEKLML